MLPILSLLLSKLAENGMSSLAGAIQAKGKAVIEEKLGVKIPNDAAQLTPELIQQLKIKSMEFDEVLVNAQKELAIANLDADKTATVEVTKRWEADMLSDSKLSKNIRPLALAGTLFTVFFFALLTAFHIAIDTAYVTLFGELLKIMIGAYFVGRSVEKGIDIYQGWTQTKGD